MTLKGYVLFTLLLALTSCGYNSTKLKSNGSGSSAPSASRGSTTGAQAGRTDGGSSSGEAHNTAGAPTSGTNAPSSEPKITFEDIKQNIFATNCVGCHNENRSTAGINVNTYLGTIANVDRVEAAILQGFMPPSGPLSDSDKELFKVWLAQGAIEK